MAILKTIKRAFGFGGDFDEELYDSALPEKGDTANSAPELLPMNSGENTPPVDMIFDTVVNMFNSSLPAFLSQSVDADKQRQLLYQALDHDVKEYMARAEESARLKGETAWQAEREKLLAEAEQLRNKAESLEQKKLQIKEKQLSADRQKRALADRVRDLETQVLTLEAEKEQLDLENKSMLNKAKAANVLQNELKELSEQEGAKTQEMQAKDARIAELENRVQELESRCADTVDKSAIEEIQQQVDMFEDVKKKMDGHIAKLKSSLAAAQAENESLRETIKENMTRHTQQQKALQEKIDALEQLQPQAPQTPLPPAKEAKPSKKSTKKHYSPEVDELISGADWLVSVPKEESPMRLVQESDEFGYNAPAKRNRAAENEAQMSLFDF